mgnify:CR=1 FL=1
MTKFYGVVGFIQQAEETSPGIWNSNIVERNYYGDILKNTRRWESSSESTNDNLVINNTISIVIDSYACQHFPSIKYVKWGEVYWKVTNVEIQRPRLLLTLGGVYNGPKAPTT